MKQICTIILIAYILVEPLPLDNKQKFSTITIMIFRNPLGLCCYGNKWFDDRIYRKKG